jgi:hypothetical protein
VAFGCDGSDDCDEGELCCPIGGGGTECLAVAECPTPQCETVDDCSPNQECCTVGQVKVCAPNCPGV